MSTSYLTCTNCGKRSPDTRRCTHCGRAFGRAPQQGDDSDAKGSWLPVWVVLGVAVVVGVGLLQWWQRPRIAPPLTVPETTTVAAPAETAAVTAPLVPVDTPRTPVPVRVEPPKAAPPQQTDSTSPAPPAPSPEPLAIDPARQRYAKTWANVRAERNNTATVLQVLDRGEIVAIDSLEDGWYRVTTDRPVVGYVDQQFLDTLPPGPP